MMGKKKLLKVKKQTANKVSSVPKNEDSKKVSAQVIEIENSETNTVDSAITEEKSVTLSRSDIKHIRGIRETEDSVIIEFGKSEVEERPYHHEDEEDKSKSYKRSFIKNCSIADDDECEHTKRFKAALPIESGTFEPIYKEDRIVDYKNVMFKGYGSTNETITKGDRIGDYLRKGAFKKTIKEFKKNPVMLIDHENSVNNIAGSYTKVLEDDNGLYLEGKISDAPELATVRMLIAEGHLQTLSIGGMFYYDDDGKGISQVDLMEVSLVAIPMNPDARFRPMA